MTRTNSDWPDKALLSTIDRVFDAALPVWLARSSARDKTDTIQVSIDLSRALIELAVDGVSDYAQLLDRALEPLNPPIKLGVDQAN
jgi:hypothetical protein